MDILDTLFYNYMIENVLILRIFIFILFIIYYYNNNYHYLKMIQNLFF